MIEITARAGEYRKGLLAAAARLSPEEAAIISDLERHGLQVPQLHDVLCGGHVLVDDPAAVRGLAVRQGQPSAHIQPSPRHRQDALPGHRDARPGGPGEAARPDRPGHLGAAGEDPGRVRQAQAAQPERPPAPDGLRGLPGDPQQRRPVGPVPDDRAAADVPVARRWPCPPRCRRRSPTRWPRRCAGSRQHDDTTAVSADLAAPVPAARTRPDPADELGQALPGRGGRGLFGNSEVWVTETPSPTAAAVLRDRASRRQQRAHGGTAADGDASATAA